MEELNARGERLLKVGKYEEALKTFQAVLEIDKDNVAARGNMAITCIKLGRFKKAKEHATLQIKHAKDEKILAGAYYYKGLANEKLGKITLAVINYRRSLKLGKNEKLREKIEKLTHPDNHKWTLKYRGTDVNRVLLDARFESLVERIIPKDDVNLIGKKHALKDIVLELMGGPPDPVRVEEDRYVVLSACRHQSCDEKAFLWYDTKEEKGIAAILHYFYQSDQPDDLPSVYIATRQYERADVPEAFHRALGRWLEEKKIKLKKKRYRCTAAM
jgi:tetratricopeptide (TPR) repeat protein